MRNIRSNNGEDRMNNIFTKYLEINKNGASAAAISGARERIRRNALMNSKIDAASKRPSMTLGCSTSVAEVLERRSYLEKLAAPSAEYMRLKVAIAKRQAIGDDVAANDNARYSADYGISFSRAA